MIIMRIMMMAMMIMMMMMKICDGFYDQNNYFFRKLQILIRFSSIYVGEKFVHMVAFYCQIKTKIDILGLDENSYFTWLIWKIQL